jgi:hypothetical protein
MGSLPRYHQCSHRTERSNRPLTSNTKSVLRQAADDYDRATRAPMPHPRPDPAGNSLNSFWRWYAPKVSRCNTGPMALAALIIAIAAAMFTGWQALTQYQVTRIERDRRHDERTPVFEIQPRVSNGEIYVSVKLITPWRLSCIQLDLSEVGVSAETPPGATYWTCLHIDVLPWQTRSWVIHYKSASGETVETIEGFLRCNVGEERWNVPVKINMREPWYTQANAGGRIRMRDLLNQLARKRLPVTTDQKVGASERAIVVTTTGT